MEYRIEGFFNADSEKKIIKFQLPAKPEVGLKSLKNATFQNKKESGSPAGATQSEREARALK